MKKRWIEFFEGEDGRLSMTRLMVFLSFFPASYAVLFHVNEGILGWYIGGYVLGYVGGKSADAFTQAATVKAENQQSVMVPDAETVNVKADGNVKITKAGE